MAGRLPKPTNVIALEGNRGKRARNHQEPQPDRLIDLAAPEWLSATARAVWADQAPKLAKLGLLTVVDVPIFGAWCTEMANYIDAQAAINAQASALPAGESPLLAAGREGKHPQPNPYLIIQSMASKKIISLGREFGMTPVGRRLSQVQVNRDMFTDEPETPTPGKRFFS